MLESPQPQSESCSIPERLIELAQWMMARLSQTGWRRNVNVVLPLSQQRFQQNGKGIRLILLIPLDTSISQQKCNVLCEFWMGVWLFLMPSREWSHKVKLSG